MDRRRLIVVVVFWCWWRYEYFWRDEFGLTFPEFDRPFAVMEKKTSIDLFGAVALSVFSLLLAFNQVVIKVTNEGLNPVFFAGVRSVGAVFCVFLWLKYRGIKLRFRRETIGWGLFVGLAFALEFLLLFVALDLTTVGRSGVIFYSMPVWMALMAHFVLPDDKISPIKAVGLSLAVAGVAVALLDRGAGEASLLGDLAALGAAIGWALTGMLAKASPLRQERPEVQLFWMVLVSGPILLILAPFFGDLVRELRPIHLWGLAFQIVVVVTFGFIFWLWLLSIYPATGVASFGFLSPVMAVLLGWALLGEELRWSIVLALALVAAGIVLVNRPVKSRKTSA